MILLLIVAIVGGFGGGYATCWASDRAYWRIYNFCPCCDRLDCARDHD